MITPRNLAKYSSCLDKVFSLSKDSREFWTGLRSSGSFLKGAIDHNWFKEHKLSHKTADMYHIYEWDGLKVWYSFSKLHFTMRDPMNSKDWSWKVDSGMYTTMQTQADIRSRLIPKHIEIYLQNKEGRELYIYNPAEAALLGQEPCLQKVDLLNNK